MADTQQGNQTAMTTNVTITSNVPTKIIIRFQLHPRWKAACVSGLNLL